MHDSRIDFSCDSPDKWSEPCFIKTSGSQTFPARVCVRAGTQIMADVKLYETLKDRIQGLFKRFTEDLVQQKTPKLNDSSQFSVVLLDVLKTDYTKQKHTNHGVVPRNVAGNRPRRVEPFYFLLVERLDGSPRIFSRQAIYFHRLTGIFCTFDISRPKWSSRTWVDRSWQSL
jgi:hypothetical protein